MENQETKPLNNINAIRAKIVAKLFGIFALLGVLGFSVYAASLQHLDVTNTIVFISTNVEISVVGNITGNSGTPLEEFASEVNADNEEGDLGTWATGYVGFAEENQPIVFTIDIENNNTERSISVRVHDYFYNAMHHEGNLYALANPALPDEEGNRVYTNMTRTLTFWKEGMVEELPWDGEINPLYEILPNSYAQLVVKLQIFDTGRSVTDFINNFSITFDNIPLE